MMKILSPNHSDFKSSGAKRHDCKLSASPSGFFFPVSCLQLQWHLRLKLDHHLYDFLLYPSLGFLRSHAFIRKTLEEELVQHGITSMVAPL